MTNDTDQQPSSSEGAELNRLSREDLINLIYKAPQYNSGIIQIVDNVAALWNERNELVDALRQAQAQVEHRNNIIEGLGYDIKDLRAELAAANADRDRFGNELLAVIAERNAVKAERDSLSRVYDICLEHNERLEARVRELEGALREAHDWYDRAIEPGGKAPDWYWLAEATESRPVSP